MKYKYNEDQTLKELKEYFDETKKQHYNHGGLETIDVIIAAGHGEGFCMGNITKYAMRYGKKEGKNEADIKKLIHYAVILLDIHRSSSTE